MGPEEELGLGIGMDMAVGKERECPRNLRSSQVQWPEMEALKVKIATIQQRQSR